MGKGVGVVGVGGRVPARAGMAERGAGMTGEVIGVLERGAGMTVGAIGVLEAVGARSMPPTPA